VIASLLVVAIGVGLLPAAELLGYHGAARVAQLIAGPILAAIGIVSTAPVVRAVRRLAYPVGLLLAIGPLVAHESLGGQLVSAAAGIAAAGLALAPVTVAERFGGGWAALVNPTLLQDRKESSMTIAQQPHGPGSAADVASTEAMSRPTTSSGGPSGRVVVVTGASAGVGRAIAHAFGKRGDSVALIARDEQALEDAKREVEALGGRALVVPLDVADADAVEAAAGRIEETLGPIDVWVNDAMVSVFSPVKEMTPAEYKRVTDVTYLGYVYGTLAALHRMLPRDRGVILQIGSALAYRAIPLQSAYCGAKHAIQGFTESLRSELFHDKSNVRVTMIQLPAVNTPQFDWVRSRLPGRPQPVPPIFQPEVIADGVVWASDHDRRELNIGYSTDLAIYANRVVPGLLDHYLARTGYESQQTAELDDPERPDNLYEPVHGLHRTHGRFDAQARDSSPQLWAATHRSAVAGVAALAGVLGVAGARMLGSFRR
jgi:NAD(P)-dependent dehydrogenase (short-subunit alcohol dehydrogenase family)